MGGCACVWILGVHVYMFRSRLWGCEGGVHAMCRGGCECVCVSVCVGMNSGVGGGRVYVSIYMDVCVCICKDGGGSRCREVGMCVSIYMRRVLYVYTCVYVHA